MHVPQPARLEARFGRARGGGSAFAVEDWLRAHGDRLVRRFDANAYVALTRAMDSHDLARGRGPYPEALAAIRTPTLVVAIESDVLYPPEEQIELAAGLGAARLRWIRSPHGHDAFLIEGGQVNELVSEFRSERRRPVAAFEAGRAG